MGRGPTASGLLDGQGAWSTEGTGSIRTVRGPVGGARECGVDLCRVLSWKVAQSDL